MRKRVWQKKKKNQQEEKKKRKESSLKLYTKVSTSRVVATKRLSSTERKKMTVVHTHRRTDTPTIHTKFQQRKKFSFFFTYNFSSTKQLFPYKL